MEKLTDFLETFRNNLIIEYNRNSLLKSRLLPLFKYYHTACTGDRIFLKYLDRIHYFTNSYSSIPQYYGGLTTPIHTKSTNNKSIGVPELPSLYSFSLKKYLYSFYLKIKNIFYNKQAVLKFTVEDEIIPDLFNKANYTEEGIKDLEIFSLKHTKDSLKDIRNIEYLGKNEFLMEAESNGNIQIKIKVKEEDGIKIEQLSSNKQ